MAGEHDNRHERIGRIRSTADLLGKFESSHAGHDPITENDVAAMKSHDLPGIFGALSFEHLLDPEGLQHRAHQRAHMLVVVDDKNFQTVEIVAHRVLKTSPERSATHPLSKTRRGLAQTIGPRLTARSRIAALT